MHADLDLLRLNLVEGITPRAVVVLLERFGSAGAALRALPRETVRLPDIGPTLAKRLREPPSEGDARAEARRADRLGIRILHLGGSGYPGFLREIPDPPIVLYARGEIRSDEEAVAVVGARKASVYGRIQAERFGGGLARAGLAVVSGLARGVDGAAHRGALDAGGRTVAVLGCGLDRVYPAEHRRLTREIGEKGLLLTEFPLGRRPRAHHFPMRNRIIAGLCHGIVVVEGRRKSGSLITARLANECGRTVYALPGRVDTDLAEGPHALIRDGAVLVTGPEHVLEDLGCPIPEERDELRPPADPLQARVVEVLDTSDPRGVDEILVAIGGAVPAVLSALTALELSGRVRGCPGRRYVRVGEG
ncbi:MAG: DNA-processing protein DprA [Planctomycetota bacterium]|jgi:DNA processing protein